MINRSYTVENRAKAAAVNPQSVGWAERSPDG